MPKNKAIFLDRDGTIIIDKGYMNRIEDIEFLPGAIDGLKKLQEKGYKLIIITNQSGIGRGYFKEEQYKRFTEELYRRLKEMGIEIAANYYCPHLPEDKCSCRKPETELVEKAIKEHEIDRLKSFFIGDKESDIEAGKRSGMKSILIKKELKEGLSINPDYSMHDLLEASSVC